MAQQKVSVELKLKNRQKGILYPERKKKEEKEVSLCCFSESSTKAMSEYQEGKLKNSPNNVYYLHLLKKQHILITVFSVKN